MKLIDAEWKGFASYADKAFVTFNTGLTGIVGSYADDERKSMGSGKSTIVMTLLYALFNKGSFKSVGEVVNDSYTEKEHMYVKYRFSKHGIIYIVERGILNGSPYLDFFQGNDPIGENKIPSRNEEILKVVGWDYDMFTASIFFEQDKLSKLVDTDGAKRREYIEKILNTRDWTLLQELPKKKIAKISEEIATNQKNLFEKNKEITEYRSLLLELDDVELQITNKEIIKEELKKSINIKETSIAKKKNDVTLLLHKRDLFKSHLATKDSIERNINNVNNSIQSNKSLLMEIINSTDKDTAALAKHKKDVVTTKSELNNLSTTLDTLNTELKNKDIVIALYNNKINQLTLSKKGYDNSICEMCDQVISDEYANNKIKTIDAEIEENKVNLQVSKDIVSDLTLTISKTKQEIASLSANINNVEKSITSLESALTNYDSSYKNAEKEIDKFEKQKVSYDNEKLVAEKNIESFTQEIQQLANSPIVTLPQLEEFINKTSEQEYLKKEEDLLQKDKKQLTAIDEELKELFINAGKKKEVTNNIDKYTSNIAIMENEIKMLEQELLINTLILKGFKEIPSNLLENNIKKIQDYSNEYIKKFILYMEICIQEDVAKTHRPIEIFYKFRDKERSYRMLSGGQKTIANLGLRLAFSKIISEKTNSVSEFIVLDEPFGYLDEYSRDLIKNVLSDLQKYYRQIIVISHIDSVTEFPNIINVRMENNKSFII